MARRAAVLGAGFIGASDPLPGSGIQSHAAAWAHHPGTRLVAFAEPDEDRLTSALARWRGTVGYRSVEALLAAERPEIVSIATPDATHARVLERVLACPSVRGVLAEKPLTSDPADAERLADVARQRGVVLAVNHSRRFAPSHKRLARWLAEERPLGHIELVRGLYVRGLKHNGTHWFDLARMLVGEIAQVRRIGPSAPGGDDDTVDVALEFVAGARGLLQGVTSGYSLFEMELIGSEGRLRIADAGQRFEAFRSVTSRWFPGFRELTPMATPAGGLADLVMHAAADLIEAVETGRDPACTAQDGIVALRLAAEALAAPCEDKDYAVARR